MIFILVYGIIALLFGFLSWRLVMVSLIPLPYNWLIWSMIIAMILIMPIPLMLRFNGVENAALDILSWISYIGMGFISILIAFIIVREVGWLVVKVGEKLQHLAGMLFSGGTTSVPSFSQERRELLQQSINMGILGIAGVLTGLGVHAARRKPKLIKVKVPIQNLPPEFDGYKIAQFSDLHVGPTIKKDYVQMVVDMVNKLHADSIVFTGDLIDGSVKFLSPDVEPLRQLSAEDGVYYITGNHEYYSGVEQWVKKVKELGLTVLLNEHQVVMRSEKKLLIAGVTDLHAKRILKSHAHNPDKAIHNAPEADVKILLAHQPGSIYDASRLNFHLQISGHTHGGQYFPWNFIVGLVQPYVRGLNKHENTWIYVNRGTGYWGPPMRFGVGSEITLLELIPA